MAQPPFLEDKFPAPSSTGIAVDTLVSTLIVDADSYVDVSTIEGYVDGDKVFDGYSGTFTPPYDGYFSSLNFLPGGSIDGYDAYELIIDKTSDYAYSTAFAIRVIADDLALASNWGSIVWGSFGWGDAYGNQMDESWSFTTEAPPPSPPPTPSPPPSGTQQSRPVQSRSVRSGTPGVTTGCYSRVTTLDKKRNG